jgi:hypothetical protein
MLNIFGNSDFFCTMRLCELFAKNRIKSETFEICSIWRSNLNFLEGEKLSVVYLDPKGND